MLLLDTWISPSGINKVSIIIIIIYTWYLTKVSTPLTFQQQFLYNFSRDNTAQMKLGYILE